MRAANPSAVTRASDRIDIKLARDPHSAGESRSDNHRLWFIPPRAVLFKIREAEKVVEVKEVDFS
jgi:hypothetical protein